MGIYTTWCSIIHEQTKHRLVEWRLRRRPYPLRHHSLTPTLFSSAQKASASPSLWRWGRPRRSRRSQHCQPGGGEGGRGGIRITVKPPSNIDTIAGFRLGGGGQGGCPPLGFQPFKIGFCLLYTRPKCLPCFCPPPPPPPPPLGSFS